MSGQTRLVILHAAQDQRYVLNLDRHLFSLRAAGLLNTWHKGQLLPGGDYAAELARQLEQATLVVLLLSSDFLPSFDRAQLDGLLAAREQRPVVPVIVRPVDLQDGPLGTLHALPSDGHAVSLWPDKDAAWLNVVQGLRRLLRANGSDTGCPFPGLECFDKEHARLFTGREAEVPDEKAVDHREALAQADLDCREVQPGHEAQSEQPATEVQPTEPEPAPATDEAQPASVDEPAPEAQPAPPPAATDEVQPETQPAATEPEPQPVVEVQPEQQPAAAEDIVAQVLSQLRSQDGAAPRELELRIARKRPGFLALVRGQFALAQKAAATSPVGATAGLAPPAEPVVGVQPAATEPETQPMTEAEVQPPPAVTTTEAHPEQAPVTETQVAAVLMSIKTSIAALPQGQARQLTRFMKQNPAQIRAAIEDALRKPSLIES